MTQPGFRNSLWNSPFYEGTPPPDQEVFPRVLPVSIGGHLYNVDLEKLRMTTMQVRRVALDDSVEPGEQSLNAAGVWPRAQDNWFLGAGQLFLDNRFAFESVYTHSGQYPSVRTRFWKSKGLFINQEGQLTLQPEQTNIYPSTNPNVQVLACDGYLYVADGAHLKFSSNPLGGSPSWTTVGTAANTIQSIATDGYRVWAAAGNSGVYETNAGTTTWTSASTPPSLPTPTSVLLTEQTGGTVGSYLTGGGGYDYYVTAVDAFGNETAASPAQALTQPASPNPVIVAWAMDTNATSFNVYRQDSGLVTGFLGNTPSATPSFTDDGSYEPNYSQVPPTSNQTGTSSYPATFVAYANGHLIGSTGPDLVEIEGDGSVTFIYSYPNPAFVWTFAFATPTAIHVGGAAGGIPYVGAIQPDPSTNGATLAPPTTATVLPAGEIPYAISYNAGSIVLATSVGVRTGTQPDSNGIFDINAAIADPASGTPALPCQCLASWGNWSYFGWPNYNTTDTNVIDPPGVTSSGLGKLDLSQYSNPGIPAYATDIMAPDGTSGPVTSVAIVPDAINGETTGVPFFVVQGLGVFGPSGNVVSTGFMECGWTRYSTLEPKILTRGTLLHEPLLSGQSISMSIATATGGSALIGTDSLAGSTGPLTYFSANYQVGSQFMPILTLNRAPGDPIESPTLHQWQTMGIVVPIRQDEWILPILMTDTFFGVDVNPSEMHQDAYDEYLYLKGLEATSEPVLVKVGGLQAQCFIDQIQLDPGQGGRWNNDRTLPWGTVTVKMITLDPVS